MKKLLTGCLLAIALLFSAQNITAQNITEINKEAAKQTETLQKLIKFDKEKMDAVFKAYKEFGKASAELSSSEQSPELLAKLNKELDKKLEGILSELEYHNYLELVRGM